MTQGVYTEFIDLNGDKSAVFRGRRQLSDIPVIIAHGATTDTDGRFNYLPNARSVIDIIANGTGAGGFICLGGILGGGLAFGNNTFIASVDSIIAASAARYGTRTDKIGFYGGSMGGCALNWMWRNPSKVAFAALMIPLISLDDVHTDNEFGFGDAIDNAYNPAINPGEAAGGYAVNGAAHDPFLNMNSIKPFGHRLSIWPGVIDPLCEIAFARTFAQTVGCDIFEHPTGHDDFFDIQKIGDWLVPRLLYEVD